MTSLIYIAFFSSWFIHPFPKQRACSQANSNAMISSSCQRKQGGAAVVCVRHLYIEEPEREHSDNNFYQQQHRDYIVNNNNTVSRIIKAAISKGERQEYAINLIVDNPRPPRFYLPNIHKPANPGRPIVSACNCPTELIATYLDAITTPLVQKDTWIYYKPTDTHSYLNYAFSHPNCCEEAIP